MWHNFGDLETVQAEEIKTQAERVTLQLACIKINKLTPSV